MLGGHGKAFCAGADLNWMTRDGRLHWEQNRADAQALADMLWAVYRCPVPVVGRVHGDCYAGGVGLAAVCDVLVAAEGANFCLSEARLGLLPATISPYVIRAMGEQARAALFRHGRALQRRAGAAMGFVHEVCAAEALDAKVDEIVAALVANGPMAARACKKLVQDVAGLPITPALRGETARRIADIRASDEGREGVQSFLNKRKPAGWPTPGHGKPPPAVDTPQLLAIAAALGWASGLRLYAVLFLTGMAGYLGWVELPPGLHLLQSPWMLGASGLMLFIEFFADKIPGVDTLWDMVHTLVRIPAGAVLAAAVFGADQSSWAMAAALMGGTLAATSHVAKATTRAAMNTSPEPFSNIAMSLLGDGVVPVHATLWLSWAHPVPSSFALGRSRWSLDGRC